MIDFGFDAGGRFVVDRPLGEVPREPVCCECGEPIAWVLDMFSFKATTGRWLLGHARCLWTDDAFDREKAIEAPRDERDRIAADPLTNASSQGDEP